MKTASILFLAFGVVASAAGQAVGPAPLLLREAPTPTPPTLLEPLLHAVKTPLVLAPDDLILIQVYNVEAFKVRTRIGRDGTIELPLAGRIALGGLTIVQAQEAIRGLLVEKRLVIDPGVTIEPIETPGNVISVSGQVLRSGVFPALGDHTLIQMIALAEGEKETASSVVTLTRPGLTAPLQIDLGPDPTHSPYGQIPVFAGDSILVSNVGQVFVLGAIGKQGIVNLRNYSPTTVIEAVTMSGGIGFQAKADDARLVRTQGAERIMINVHVGKILQGKEPDIALKNDDILYIPTSAEKAALKGGAAGIIAGFATAFLYTR
jgi:polysaccharide export outer membrane protein